MPNNMPNTLRVFTITTSLGEEMTLSAIDEWQAKQLFLVTYPRHRISSIREIDVDPASFV